MKPRVERFVSARADAPVISHAWEWATTEDLGVLGYTEAGHTKGMIAANPTPPQRLRFELHEEVRLLSKT